MKLPRRWGIFQQHEASVVSNRPITESRNTTLIGVVIVVVILYFARVVLIPLALAILVAFLLAPLVMWLRRRGIGRIPSVLIVVHLAFAVIAGLAFLLAIQLTELGHQMPEYEQNIHNKMKSIRDSSSGVIGKFSRFMHDFNQELSAPASGGKPAPGEQKPVPVEIEHGPFSSLQMAPKVLGSLAGLMLTAIIVIVFVIFMLLQQEDLRDRIIRLAGSGRLNATTKALDEAGERVSRYLLAQLIVNVCFGIPAGVALYFLGVPNPILWGMLAALFRYVPYLGIWIAAVMPAAVLFAVDPGWVKPFSIFGIYFGIDLMMYNFVEPWVYGNSTGMTPLAILVAAVFWTWLWGALAGGFALSPGKIVAVDSHPSVAFSQGSLAVESVTTHGQANLIGSDIVSVPVAPQFNDWTPALEKEFHILAAQEAGGMLTEKALRRLDELNFLRDTLKTPRTSEEILLQMQRDRIIDKISEALEEYVEFQKTSRKAGGISKQKV